MALEWDPSADGNIVAYRVYHGAQSRQYTNFVEVAEDSRTAVIAGLLCSGTYYFAATAVDSEGLESDFSNEVFFETPDTGSDEPIVVQLGPTASSGFTVGQQVPLYALLEPWDHQIRSVQFLADGKVIAESTSPPYVALWSPTASGRNTLQTRIVYDFAGEVLSRTVDVVIGTPRTRRSTLPEWRNTKYSPHRAPDPAPGPALDIILSELYGGSSDPSHLVWLLETLNATPGTASMAVGCVFATHVARADLSLALRYLQSLDPGEVRSCYLEAVALELASEDFAAALQWVLSLEDEERNQHAVTLIERALNGQLKPATREPDPELLRIQILVESVSAWAKLDYLQAAQWMRNIPEPILRDYLLDSFVAPVQLPPRQTAPSGRAQ